jgi:hypothetical protein
VDEYPLLDCVGEADINLEHDPQFRHLSHQWNQAFERALWEGSKSVKLFVIVRYLRNLSVSLLEGIRTSDLREFSKFKDFADHSMYSTFLTASPGSILFSRSALLKRKDLCFSCLRLGLIRHRRNKKPHAFFSKSFLNSEISQKIVQFFSLLHSPRRDTLVTEVSLTSREPNLRFERISISRVFLWKSFNSFPFCTRHAGAQMAFHIPYIWMHWRDWFRS